ncbi:hypothetical protein ACWC2T_08855 [Streptomyces sp. NPDC001393]
MNDSRLRDSFLLEEKARRAHDRAMRRKHQHRAEARRARERIESVLSGRIDEEAAAKCRVEVAEELQRRAAAWLAAPELKAEPVVPRITVESNATVKSGSYDSVNHIGGASAAADDGTFSLNVQSIGQESDHAWISIGSWFTATEDNPQQRFAADVAFNIDWWDSAEGYVAHNDFTTSLNVWKIDFSAPPPFIVTVLNTQVQPTWSDGVGWLESHGQEQFGVTVSPEGFFSAEAGVSYMCSVDADALVDSDGGIFGFGASTIHVGGCVKDLVFGDT